MKTARTPDESLARHLPSRAVEEIMGRFALFLLILALVAAFVGFGSLALAAGKVLFIIFLILALIVYAGTFYTRPID